MILDCFVNGERDMMNKKLIRPGRLGGLFTRHQGINFESLIIKSSIDYFTQVQHSKPTTENGTVMLLFLNRHSETSTQTPPSSYHSF